MPSFNWDLISRVERYEKARARGTARPSDHEALYARISDQCGDVVAEYFDKEFSLPYEGDGWGEGLLPWPMKQHQAFRFDAVRWALLIVGALVVLTLGGFLTPHTVAVWWSTGGLALVLAVEFAVTFLPRLLPPKDLETRRQKVSEFAGMRAKNRDAEEQRAAAQRDSRRLRAIEDEARDFSEEER